VSRLEENEKSFEAVVQDLRNGIETRDKQLDQVSQDLAMKENEVMELSEKLQEQNTSSPVQLSSGNILLFPVKAPLK
jgi:uncharacterized protein (DUF3084 family)